MVEGWLVYDRADYAKNRAFADQFPGEGRKRGLDISLKYLDEICLTLSGGRLASGSALPAFVLNRARDWRLAIMFEQAGCRVFNSAAVSRVGNDKILSHQLAARLGIPQVDTAFCENAPAGLLRHGIDYPVVLKNPYGHGGGDVFLAHGDEELLALASGMRCDKLIVQRLCGRPGMDVRIYALGGRILAAVKRTSASDFRANLSLGGSVEYYTLNPSERELAEHILAELKPDYAGIDFIMDTDGGFLFNEIEDAVGSRSLYMLGGFDVVGLLLDHVASEMYRVGAAI